MRKNVNIFFAVIGTVLIDTSFKAFCTGHLEVSNFSQNIQNLEVWARFPYLGIIVKVLEDGLWFAKRTFRCIFKNTLNVWQKLHNFDAMGNHLLLGTLEHSVHR